MRIIIADDAIFMRSILKDILVKLGHEVVGEAENGIIAIELYKQTKPDMTILDITMPEMGGIEALREIRKIDPNANVLMCTVMGQRDLIIEAVKAGAKDFIVKPFQPERVRAALMLPKAHIEALQSLAAGQSIANRV